MRFSVISIWMQEKLTAKNIKTRREKTLGIIVLWKTSDIWYRNRVVGKDTLGKFMPELSKRCSLSRIYTNHSVRTTGVTILTKRNFSAGQIMSLTGHRSVNSLALPKGFR
ncbi:hypothetical protein KUTeg_001835 [Tegillarca granosa]|uniref:Uncharacterized protein n=1 Tax=Tegillarca granosa TaxID=220873 RepID=A0ABQ9FX01_TEGGR|nr:hypothetical protein KUTeg_001835 [Tegillarca granosa]